MKVEVSNEKDRLGRYPLLFSGYKNLDEIHSWLFDHYQGYKFCIIFNETMDEYEELDKPLRVDFLDEVYEEVKDYIGG